MYKAVFKSRKMALLFVAMTLFSAIRMVGSEDEGGILAEATRLSEGSAGAAASGPAPTRAQDAGGQGSSDPVFGDYEPPSKPAAAAAR